MTLEQVWTLLKGVEGFSEKVTYYTWPINEAPALPFVCFFEQQADTFPADNVAYYVRPRYSVEVYCKNRSPQIEALFEAAFTSAGIFFTKETEYLDDEKCQVTVYQI